jgi:SAM-dependent methyltransferase
MITDQRDTPAFWDERARPFLGTKDEWLAVSDIGPVADQVHRLEGRGIRVLAAHLPRGARTVDAGCGVGRWFPAIGPGRSLVGMDFAPSMVHAATANPLGVPVVLGDVRSMPFKPEEFDAGYTVKVLQCLPAAERPIGIASLFRSVRQGGTVILFEKIQGGDGSRPSDWIRWGEQAGGRLLRWYGNQFAPVDRAFVGATRRLTGRTAQPQADAASRQGSSSEPLRGRHPKLFRLYSLLRATEFRVSSLLEPVFERTLPPHWAEHGIFVFQKSSRE